MPQLNPLNPVEQHPSTLQTLIDGVSNVPVIIQDSITNAAQQSAQRAAEQTAEYAQITAIQTAELLTQRARNYFEELLAKKTTVDSIEATLNQLIEHYHTEKSLLTKWAQWFGEMNWFETIGYGVAFVSLSAIIGATFNMAALFGLIAIGLYYSATTLLVEHHTITTDRDNQLIHGIHAMKTNLADLIEQLTELATKVHDIQCDLFQKNRQTTEELDIFKTKVLEMDAHIQALDEAVNTLNQAKDLLINENIRIIKERDRINMELQATHDTLIKQTTELNDIHLKFEETNRSFLNRNNDIIDLSQNLNSQIPQFAELQKLYQTELIKLQSRTTRVTNPVDNTPPPTAEETNQRIQRSNDLLKQAEEYLLNRNGVQIESRGYLGNSR